MSVLSTVVTDVEKFFKTTDTDLEKFAAAFVRLFKKAPSALQTVDNFVGEVALVITAAVALANPAVEPVVASALATVETGLAAISASAAAATGGQSVLTNLQNFAATVPQLLSGVAIKDTKLQSAVTKIVNLVVSECKVLIPAVENWVAQIAQSSTTSTTATA